MVYLPVYPLNLTVTGSPSSMSAKEVAGNAYTMALNSQFRVDPEQHEPAARGVPACSTTMAQSRLAYYVWVTPAGECNATTAPTSTTTPPAHSAMQRSDPHGDCVMSGLQRALERRWPSAARSDPRACERGFTALELITVLAILAVVFTIVTSLFISFNQQTTNTQDSVVGIQEETQAQQTLIQYLRGASQLLPVYDSSGTQVGPSATELDAITSEGFNTSTYNSNCTNLDALWFKPSGAVHADAQFDITFDVPASGPPSGLPWSSLIPVDVPAAFTPASSCTPASPTPRTVATYFALSSQTSPVFTYYFWNNSVLTALPVQTPVRPSMRDQRGRGCRHPHHVPRGTPGPDRRLCRRRADDFGHDCLPAGLGDGDDRDHHDHHDDDRTLPKLRR